MRALRQFIRGLTISGIDKVSRAPEVRGITSRLLRKIARLPRDLDPSVNRAVAHYPDLAPHASKGAFNRDDVVLITARYRSGSTMLWNLMRQLQGVTAYYEPVHPRLGLPPDSPRGEVDPSHLHVDDY